MKHTAAIRSKRAPTTNMIAPAALLSPTIDAPLIQPLQQKLHVVHTLSAANRSRNFCKKNKVKSKQWCKT